MDRARGRVNWGRGRMENGLGKLTMGQRPGGWSVRREVSRLEAMN
jgi:hypothetical protein